jgi:hypothetical protein
MRIVFWLSVENAGPLWKWWRASIVRLDASASVSKDGSLAPFFGGGRNSSFNFSDTITRDIDEAKESSEINSGFVSMNWETMFLPFGGTGLVE